MPSIQKRILQKPDKSVKGSIDVLFLPLYDIINSSTDFVTTSCCSGRIAVFNGTKNSGSWIYVSHAPCDPEAVVTSLNGLRNESESGLGEALFKFEPFVIHIECSSEEHCKSLLSLSIKLGFKNSGIISMSKRFIIAIRGCLRLEVPLALNGTVLVSTDYIETLCSLANQKLTENTKQIEKLTKAISLLVNPHQTSLPQKFDVSPIPEVNASGETLLCYGLSKLQTKTGRLFFFGGHHKVKNRCNFLWELEEKGITHRTPGISAPSARVYSASAGQYLFGGRAGPNSAFADFYRVSDAGEFTEIKQTSDIWPEARYRHCACVDRNGNFFILGGKSADEDVSRSFWKFNGSLWEKLADCPISAINACLVTDPLSDDIFLLNGGDVIFKFNGSEWAEDFLVGPTPESRYGHATCKDPEENAIYMVGGFSANSHGILRDVWKLSEMKWEKLGELPEDAWRARFQIHVEGNEMFLFGGGGTVFTFGSAFDPPMKICLSPKILGSAAGAPRLLAVKVKEKHEIQETRDLLRKFRVFDESRKLKFSPNLQEWLLPVKPETENVWEISQKFSLVDEATEEVQETQIEAPTAMNAHRLHGKFEKLGDIILLSKEMYTEILAKSDASPSPKSFWKGFCTTYKCRGVGLLGSQITGDMRESGNNLLYIADDSPFVIHTENKVKYFLDLTKHMFASGNGTERMRAPRYPGLKDHEILVDLFCGIGYFSLPLLTKTNLKKLYACDWNLSALECFKTALTLNNVDPNRVEIYPGDSSTAYLKLLQIGVQADRISLGLIPDSKCAYLSASKLLNKQKGGWLHIHGIASDPDTWKKETIKSFEDLGMEIITCKEPVKVKNYRPKVKHYVLDVYAKAQEEGEGKHRF
jgi:tRNA G37 N-methylase Trm5/tRNA(Phe) wybutosine-synthesizing methylase Tyw3